MSNRQVVVAYTDNLTALLAWLAERELTIKLLFASTSQIIVGEESILMLQDRPHKLERILQPIIDAGLMQALGAKQLIMLTDENGEPVGTKEAVYIQNPKQPWLDMSEAELELVQRLTGYHLQYDYELQQEVPSGRNWFGGFA